MAFLQWHILMYLLEVKRKERKGRKERARGGSMGRERAGGKERGAGEGRFSAGAGQ